MSTYNMLAYSDEGTVVSDYKPEKSSRTGYQSEAQLEETFIKQLERQGYDRLTINSEKDLIDNLRSELERLNNVTFSDTEWKKFFNQVIANDTLTIADKTHMIQKDNIQLLERDDGSKINIRLIDQKDIHKNSLQVINQYTQDKGDHENRYDVTVLVNGFPLVHTELKRRGVNIKEAFNQIDRYGRESFWAGSGLFDYIQIFVISNGTETKYYSNTTRETAINEREGSNKRKKKTSNSFEFTSYWSDTKNKLIPDLVDFAKTFFAKHTLLNILTKYCVFTSEEQLLVMRPYQITATEKIINKIRIANNYKKAGTTDAGGYIWHTTGSGKTLTSFKASQLATALDEVNKVIFVVDRKDLDSQTIKEYDRFQKGSANGNTSTKVLKEQLESPNTKIIITTIQKLNNFIKQNKKHPVYNEPVCLIFDECHRSQFGEMHTNITKHFKKYYIFGFTGTPIFAENTGSGKNAFMTTEQTFGQRLHTYTIVNAIGDHNVLPFSIQTVNTFAPKEGMKDEKITAIDREKNFMKPERIRKVAQYILDNFDRKTKRNGTALTNEIKRKKGFNSLFAVSSIPMAQRYYNAFKELQKDSKDPLRVATIFSYAPNEEDISRSQNPNGTLDDESFDTESLDKNSRAFLDMAIDDYNQMFGTNFDTSSASFQNYYEDLTKRIKNRELDLVIVVNMLLTGFDATTLNTLWVDKNLRMHGLIQAFSRTNRILNSVKSFGNIVTFRNLSRETDEALKIFGDEEANSVVILRPYEDYYKGYNDSEQKHHMGYEEVVGHLKRLFPDVHLPEQTKEEKREFARLFGQLLRLMNILSTFEQFENEKILSEADFQDYMSSYHRIREDLTGEHGTAEDVSDDLVFELELVSSIEVDIDYILKLIEEYHKKGRKDQEIRDQINRNIDSSIRLRSKKELINKFIDAVNGEKQIDNEWVEFLEKEKDEELERIIREERLKPEQTQRFMRGCLRDGKFHETGTGISDTFTQSRFTGKGKRSERKKKISDRLRQFFDKFSGLVVA